MGRKTKLRLTLCLCVAAVALAPVLQAQPSTSLDARITAVLARMGSPDRGVRNKALDDMLAVMFEGQEPGFDPEYGGVVAGFLARHPEQADRVKLGFINLLKADNARGEPLPPGVGSEDNSEHYAGAVQIVSSLNDERAIPALIGAIDTGGMAMDGLAKYGQMALTPVLHELNDSPNRQVRSSALMTALKIWKAQGDAASRAQMLDTLGRALTDANVLLRDTAIWAIENVAAVDQTHFVPTLQNMSKHDPDDPLRARAKRLLDKIANHQH